MAEQLRGPQQILAALDAGERLGLILVREGSEEPEVQAVLARAREARVPIREGSESVLRRMTSVGAPSDLLALRGRVPEAELAEVFEARGAVWLLAGIAYPTNAGVALRTAEGSGAEAVIVDSDADWDHEGRRTATRASMRADWYMPVLWESAEIALEQARAHDHRVISIENTGTHAPWEVDLRGPALFVVGGESKGIPASVLAASDEIVRIPMDGFIPSYNLQIAIGVVATERLRQGAKQPT